ncbi:receptor protein kinase-like protein At4g34220 isoform X2 [Malania oleifera]|uniref:receptor protein kinase-like protein At4g34220 isoform X2 n=1 Tax=Malania oleifera TaxID=397392 RepID=UPI0025ADAE2A|nr:receptor protein kinase-like protein At4g34220 isoform X2 [Malania oleifera]
MSCSSHQRFLLCFSQFLGAESVQEIMSTSRSDDLHFWWKITSFLLLLHSSFALNSDGVSLLSLKYNILGDPLSVLESWNYDDETPCSWTGVICAEIGNPGSPDMFRVISLALPNSQLLGSLSSDLGMIEHLRFLDLSNNFFNGSLPASLFNASELQVLSLASNALSGELPEAIGRLTNLSFLNLSVNAFAGRLPESLIAPQNLSTVSLRSNHFSGTVPSGFNTIQVLDLSSNLFNGSLPGDFGGGSLVYLNLSYNKLFGKIPPEFAQIPANATIDIAFNNLTGEIPQSDALWNQKKESFTGNIDLCGKPLKILCSIPSSHSTPPNASFPSSPAIAAIPKTFDTNTVKNSSTTSDGAQEEKQAGLKPGTIAGIAVGDLAGISILAIIFLSVYQIKRKKQNPSDSSDTPTSEKGPKGDHPLPSTDSRGLGGTCSCLAKNGDETSDATCSDAEGREVTGKENGDEREKVERGGSLVMVDGEMGLEMENLLKARAYVLGASGRSIVYKAVLEDGTALAVRRIGESGGFEMRLKEFENQVRMIAKLRHPNLVRVRGFYWGDDEKLLISDYVSNGSLATVGKNGSSPYHLPLEARFKIARGIARALAHIHDKKHVHGNLKPSNVLLTHNFDPVISDFGLHRLLPSHHRQSSSGGSRSTASGKDFFIAGDHPHFAAGADQAPAGFVSPYAPPESLKNLRSNSKWDVYSFGILLLELLTGRAFSDREVSRWSAEPAVDEKNRVLLLADGVVRAEVEGARVDALLACFRLGFDCAAVAPQKRPSMKEALQVMERVTHS